MTWKIVYYGPAMSGKTTNLIALHDLVGGPKKSQMMQMNTREDRTLFFDLLPMTWHADSGARLKIKLYTVPGQVQYDSTRKAVLMRADAVVFVADSQCAQSRNNSESFANLEKNCRQVGLDFDRIPLVVQYNKRDLPGDNIVAEEKVAGRWQEAGIPLIFSSAMYGRGVLDTFETVLRLACRDVDRRHKISDRFGIREEQVMSAFLQGAELKDGGTYVPA